MRRSRPSTTAHGRAALLLALLAAVISKSATEAFTVGPTPALMSRGRSFGMSSDKEEAEAEPEIASVDEGAPKFTSPKGAIPRPDPQEEDDGPLMAAGRALKPLNDLVELVISSEITGPILFLLPFVASPKVREEVGAFIDSLLQ